MKKITFILLIVLTTFLLFGCTENVEQTNPENGGTVISETDNTNDDSSIVTTTTIVNNNTTVETSQATDPQTQATKSVYYGEGIIDAGIYYQLGLSDTFIDSAKECEEREDTFKKTIFYVDYEKPNPYIQGIYLKFYDGGTMRKKSLSQYASTTGITRIYGDIPGECYPKGWVEMYNDGNNELLWSGPVYPNQ
jgi:hypothetical protein